MHTDRRLNPQTNQWEDGRTTVVDVNFYGPAAERYAQTIQQQPDAFAKGTAVVAWGELSDHPDTWTDRDGNLQATPVINGTRIIPNQLVNQRRARRQQAHSTSCRNTPTRSRNRIRGSASSRKREKTRKRP